MKTKFFLIPAVILVVTTSWISPQETPINSKDVVANLSNDFAFFRTHRQGKGVTATWGMAAATNIVGFTIQRTYEDPSDPYAYWEDLSMVACDARRSFSYNDNVVYPGIVNYRIVAMKSDGNTVVSEISSVRIVSRH